MTATLTAARAVPAVARETGPQAAIDARRLRHEELADARTAVPDIVDIWGLDSFPASDAPANW